MGKYDRCVICDYCEHLHSAEMHGRGHVKARRNGEYQCDDCSQSIHDTLAVYDEPIE